MNEKAPKATTPKVKRAVTRNEKTRDQRTVGRFLEELSWLLTSYSNLDYRALADVFSQPQLAATPLTDHVSKNKNIHFLVGTLPSIFSDEKYFPANEDIVDFAKEALELSIARWEKRSRYELIGLIVCETGKLSDPRLARLVDALSRITAEDPGARAILQDRKSLSLSWNDVIQQLTNGHLP